MRTKSWDSASTLARRIKNHRDDKRGADAGRRALSRSSCCNA